ncbi:hypothetical protein [Gordonia sp. UCD-TK1]|uniref:hypothetical protein n=1 Tax=Gordonia sp. UCD-TK1 TaxID=1857893 RepID=UPI00080D92B6|nr:hypothetical protein [Gordonia sp. UCD-TK1]OCH82288.1 hypothetical protein A9310_13990 [Gordonia sp. UCD-TK1]
MTSDDDLRAACEFWANQPQDRRDLLNRSAQNSILQLPRYPYWSQDQCAELVHWSRLEGEVLAAYTNWLERLEARALRHGRQWDRTEFLRQCRLAEAGD